jgi:hypothetical protein
VSWLLESCCRRIDRHVVLHIVSRVDARPSVVIRFELLGHFVNAYVVEIVHNAGCLPMGTFKSKCAYSSGT